MVSLTKHFTLKELTRSEAAKRIGASNQPDGQQLGRLVETAERLEEVRKLLGDGPIIVTSGFRTQTVNRAIGGSNTSAHCQGYGVDFYRHGWAVSDTYRFLLGCYRRGVLEFDQLIKYETHVHISFDPRLRGQAWAEE